MSNPTNKFDQGHHPLSTCTVCRKNVSPRRAITMCYPNMTLCQPCYDVNLDKLDVLSENYDDSSLVDMSTRHGWRTH